MADIGKEIEGAVSLIYNEYRDKFSDKDNSKVKLLIQIILLHGTIIGLQDSRNRELMEALKKQLHHP